jgi:hypothetical protein
MVLGLAGCAPQVENVGASDGVESLAVEPTPAREIGACPEDLDGEPLGWENQVGEVLWVETEGFSVIGPDPHSSRFTKLALVEPVIVEKADLPPLTFDTVSVLNAKALAMVNDLPHSSKVLLAVTDGVEVERYASLIIFMRSDGSIAVPGDCAFEVYVRPVELWAASFSQPHDSETVAEFIYAMLSTPDAVAWDTLFEVILDETPDLVEWGELSPAERLTDVENTPPDVLQDLRSVAIEIVLPTDWRQFPFSLCSRNPLGWNECTLLNGGPTSGRLQLLGYGVEGEPVELWLMSSLEEGQHPIGRIAVIPAAAWSSGPVLVAPASGSASLSEDELRRQAESGVSVFQVTTPD